MFTTEQIAAAHSKVKSGSDFPNYVNDLKDLGVKSYETYVSDGHTVYYGESDFKTATNAKYENLHIQDECSIDQFKADLKAHQQGTTDYPTFCSDCAKSGIEKWVVSINDRTCGYFDNAGNAVLIEQIP